MMLGRDSKIDGFLIYGLRACCVELFQFLRELVQWILTVHSLRSFAAFRMTGQNNSASLRNFSGQALHKLILHVIQSAAKDLYVGRTLENQLVDMLKTQRMHFVSNVIVPIVGGWRLPLGRLLEVGCRFKYGCGTNGDDLKI
jgi:hypothetical protein